MTYQTIKKKLEDFITYPRRGRIAGCEVETAFYPSSDSVHIYVQGQQMSNKEVAAFTIYDMHRKSGIA